MSQKGGEKYRKNKNRGDAPGEVLTGAMDRIKRDLWTKGERTKHSQNYGSIGTLESTRSGTTERSSADGEGGENRDYRKQPLYAAAKSINQKQFSRIKISSIGRHRTFYPTVIMNTDKASPKGGRQPPLEFSKAGCTEGTTRGIVATGWQKTEPLSFLYA